MDDIKDVEIKSITVSVSVVPRESLLEKTKKTIDKALMVFKRKK